MEATNKSTVKTTKSTVKTTKSINTTKTTAKQKEQKEPKLTKAQQNAKEHNVRKGLQLNTSAKATEKRLEECLDILIEVKSKIKMDKVYAIDNKVIPGGWGKVVVIDDNNNTIGFEPINVEPDKQLKLQVYMVSMLKFPELHNTGKQQYKEWKKQQRKLAKEEQKAN